MFIATVELKGYEQDGSGTRCHNLCAETIEDAIIEVSDFENCEVNLIEYYGEECVYSCEISEVGETVDFLAIHKDKEKIRKAEAKRVKVAQEYKDRQEQYIKLKKEFG